MSATEGQAAGMGTATSEFKSRLLRNPFIQTFSLLFLLRLFPPILSYPKIFKSKSRLKMKLLYISLFFPIIAPSFSSTSNLDPSSNLDPILPNQPLSFPIHHRRKFLSPRKYGAGSIISEERELNSLSSSELRRAVNLKLTEPDEDDVNQTEFFEDNIFSTSRSNLSTFNVPSKRQSDGQQAAIVTDNDPVAAAALVEQLPNVAGNTQGADNDDNGDIVKGDGDESNYPWNAGTL